MKRSYYHATPFENLASIFDNGIRKGYDGVVYLTEKPEEAARFVAVRGCDEILVCEVELENDMIEESFDHSMKFFRCRAFTYPEDISRDDIKNYMKYEL